MLQVLFYLAKMLFSHQRELHLCCGSGLFFVFIFPYGVNGQCRQCHQCLSRALITVSCPGGQVEAKIIENITYDKLSDQRYTSLPKSDKIESGKMVFK